MQQGFEPAVQLLITQAVSGAVAVEHEAHTAKISIQVAEPGKAWQASIRVQLKISTEKTLA